ncbi:hypothetical protein QJS04_geneDACA008729 [Acorus gramineus]|uniref:SH2 domain-containing protein n=1 Tax=Acorus gramineus TaxID=55184 RepID=A0AAV9ADP3_ACOGR|nr:hypothetical protein QJS04_geneDACA008729 [Acorus gramineus]
MADEAPIGGGEEEYKALKDIRLEIGGGREDWFCLCFWIYLTSPFRSPATIIRQVHLDDKYEKPFLALNEEKKLMLFPLLSMLDEPPGDESSIEWVHVPHVSAESECPFDKWVHVGCEVANKSLRLHINGVAVGEMSLPHSLMNDDKGDKLERECLVGNDGRDGKCGGYLHNVEFFASSSSILDHFVKNPPLLLSIDSSHITEEVEEGGDGVWSIIGGKASCRRNFTLEAVLLDAFGKPVHREKELMKVVLSQIVASLVYADSREPVEKHDNDADAPLLSSIDGDEFPSTDKPVKLFLGRASFKLKISQLSYKCDNKLFRVCLEPTKTQKFPFLQAYSPRIRCISRHRIGRTSSDLLKKSTCTMRQGNGTQSPGHERSLEAQDDSENGNMHVSDQHESRCTPSSKRVKMAQQNSSLRVNSNSTSGNPYNLSNSHAKTTNGVTNAIRTSSGSRSENIERTENILSDSESTDARNSGSKGLSNARSQISDETAFRYCLEGVNERSVVLKEVISYASGEDMVDFAHQISLYTGCSHHRNQILIAKQLMKEGDNLWTSISHNRHQVLWRDSIPEIDRKFKMISHSSRGLSGQDFELLQRISGSAIGLMRANFDKMWFWLYPVAFALSKNIINTTWDSTSPKWIEGLITKEEAEASLRSPQGFQKPGTFILRFPTTRSWPHPDAGSLVVTYVGSDHSLHHRLLSLDDRVTRQVAQ